MKNKYIVAILVAGMILTTMGALFKITHIEIYSINGNSILIVGLVAEALAGSLFIAKSLSDNNKKNEFLNK